MLKVNLGCGSIQPEGWTNIDHDPEFGALSSVELLENDSVDIMVAHAMVQQIQWHDLPGFFQLLKQKLKPGGVLRISLPDISNGFDAYRHDDIDWFPNGESDIDDRFSAWLTWYSTSCTLMTSYSLLNKLEEAGFEVRHTLFGVSIFDSTQESVALDTRQHEFYFVEARNG